jgi:DNA-binding CsgD family transcriptional regulator/GAF domain-containing protein
VIAALADIAQRLRPADSIAELFKRGAREACAGCGFDRAVIATVEGRALTTGSKHVWDADDANDLLARELLLRPVTIDFGSEEARAVQAPDRTPAPRGNSVLREALALTEYAIVPIVPEGQALALLVVDRACGPVSDTELRDLEVYAHLIGAALERMALRTRLQNMSAELRQLTASAHALMNEALCAPVSASTESGCGMLFTETGYGIGSEPADLADTFSPRELQIAELLCAGRSNREIAGELFIAPDTVKDHVARLVRKLDACNRVEAAARYVALRGG